VLDFYCAAARLGIELDGGIHRETEQAAYDRQRSEDLAELGVLVLRFWNDEVLSDPENVIRQIIGCIEERMPSPLAAR
jgi:very-short-patch-repair endonuclease